MKINPSSYQAYMPIQTKKQQPESVVTEETLNPKQALKENAQRIVSEINEARTDMGEDDPKAQRLIEKFKNGQKLSREEMNYIRQNAPGIMDYVDRIMRERDMIERSMKAAPSKTDVQMVVYRTSKQIEKDPDPDIREVRAKHLADAKQEYEQTDDYKKKPNSPLEKEERPLKVRYKKNPKHYEQIAIQTYDRSDIKKVGTHFEQQK